MWGNYSHLPSITAQCTRFSPQQKNKKFWNSSLAPESNAWGKVALNMEALNYGVSQFVFLISQFHIHPDAEHCNYMHYVTPKTLSWDLILHQRLYYNPTPKSLEFRPVIFILLEPLGRASQCIWTFKWLIFESFMCRLGSKQGTRSVSVKVFSPSGVMTILPLVTEILGSLSSKTSCSWQISKSWMGYMYKAQ